MKKSYSERGEDAFIDSLGILPDKGFYLDVGCAWSCLYSNTAFLRDHGWKGINVDGNASYAPSWEGVALFTNCVIGDGKPAHFESNGVPELSRFGQGQNSELVPTKRLDDLLQFSAHVDFLSIDTEGSEFDALQTFDWKKNRPICICAEYSTAGAKPENLPEWARYSEQKQAIEDFRVKEFLESMGYSECCRNDANIIFTL